MDQVPYSAEAQQVVNQRPLSQIALWSMILGILFLCLGPLALIPMTMGIIGISITGSQGRKSGMGFAIAGTSLGAVGSLGMCLSAGILLPALGQARQRAQELVSQTYVRSQLQAAVSYANENGDMFPPVNQWPDAVIDLGLIDSTMLVSPVEDGDGISYIYLGGEFTFDALQIVIYEDPKHYEEGVIVGFADAHVEMIPHAEFEAMLEEQTSDQAP